MMLASMTGFARSATVTPQGSLAWEIKTVNAKGLDIRLRTPGGFEAQEAAFRARIATALTRGACQASLTVQRPSRQPEVRIDARLLRALIDAIGAATPAGAAVAPVTLDGLLAIRGVVEIGEPVETPEDRAVLHEAVMALLDEAVAGLQATRRAEGSALAAVLAGHLERIAGLTEAAEQAPGRTPEAIRNRLEQTVATLFTASPALDPARLHQEAVLLATRADVREELDRLAIHCRAARAHLHEGGAVGRRLDFLAQEMAREANTLCAKSNDAGLTATGLDLRNQIEQVREQVQNLE